MGVKELVKKSFVIINHLPFNNKFKGKTRIVNNGALLINCRIISQGTENSLILEKGGVFRNCEFMFIGNKNTMKFGENFHAYDGSFYTEDDKNAIEVGDNSMFAGKIHIACTESTKCTVGNGCLFSSEIVIRTGDSHSILSLSGERINPAKDVKISDRVWIGHRVLINKGVSIGSDSVVGTGAVVTKQFNDTNVIIAGVPAKVVKRDIVWEEDKRA